MNQKELSRDMFVSFLDSNRASAETSNYILEKKEYSGRNLVFARPKVYSSLHPEKQEQIILAIYNDQVLIYDDFEITFEVAGIRNKVVSITNLSILRWTEFYVTYQNCIVTDFMMDQYNRLPAAYHADGMIATDVLNWIIRSGYKSVMSLGFEDAVRYLIKNTNILFSPVFSTVSLMTADSKVFEELKDQLKWLSQPENLDSSGRLISPAVNSMSFQVGISACQVKKSLTSLERLGFDPFSKKFIEMRKRIEDAVPSSANSFHVIYKDDDGQIHDEKLSNGICTFYCTDRTEPLFLGLVQTDPNPTQHYHSCILYGNHVLIPANRIQRICYRKKVMLDIM